MYDYGISFFSDYAHREAQDVDEVAFGNAELVHERDGCSMCIVSEEASLDSIFLELLEGDGHGCNVDLGVRVGGVAGLAFGVGKAEWVFFGWSGCLRIEAKEKPRSSLDDMAVCDKGNVVFSFAGLVGCGEVSV